MALDGAGSAAASADRIVPWLARAVALAGVVYTLYLLTNGTWVLFADEKFGLLYNDYYLSLLDGRLDVKADLIGIEGFYVDGKVYTYFGIVPALLRALWAPFVDLETTSVARPMMWIFVCAAACVAQATLTGIYRAYGYGGTAPPIAGRGLYLALVALIWFGGPSLILAGNASIYHEAIAVAWLLTALFVWAIWRYLPRQGTGGGGLLAVLALLAGLALHVRLNVGIALYATAVGFLALSLWQGYRERSLKRSTVLAVPPLAIMFAFGVALLALNWAKWGDPFQTAPWESYGVLVLGKDTADGDRFESINELGSFNLRRVVPNTIYYATGAYVVQRRAADILGAGHIRVEPPLTALPLLWGIIVLLLARQGHGTAGWRGPGPAGLAWGLAIVVLFVLSFQTVTYRYVAELFYPLFVLILAGFSRVLVRHAAAQKPPPVFYPAVTGLVVLVAVVLAAFNTDQSKQVLWLAAPDSPYAGDAPSQP